MRSCLSVRPLGLIKTLTVLVLGTLTLSGCASFSADGGFGTVRDTTRARIGADARWARDDADRKEVDARVAELLTKPLTVEDAVQVAIYNNRGLRASFYELGISEAEMVQAGRLPNPHFSMLRASRAENGVREFKIEQVLTFNLFALITMPMAVEVEKRNFAQTQRMTALEVARVASETRKAYFGAIAAEESSSAAPKNCSMPARMLPGPPGCKPGDPAQ